MKPALAFPMIAAGIVLAVASRAQEPVHKTPTAPSIDPEQRSLSTPSRAELCAKADSLIRATQRGCIEKVREFLAANGIDNKNGRESDALRTAIRSGSREIVQLLITAGAPVNPSETALWPH